MGLNQVAKRMPGGLIGVSVQMQRVYALIHHVSAYSYPVLIVGESGTGKELAARSIHALGARRSKPFKEEGDDDISLRKRRVFSEPSG